mgnify:CR=1 FL=1
MNITEQEKRIESLCRKDLYEENKNQVIKNFNKVINLFLY